MAKAKRKPSTPNYADIGPTRERMQHDPSEIVNGKIEKAGERVPSVRQFRTARVDQLYKLGALSWSQHFAAAWWRTCVEDGLGNPRVVADYGQSTGGGSRDPSPIPLTDKAEYARRMLNGAKAALSIAHRMAIEDALDDPHPVIGEWAAKVRLRRWQGGLQALAVHIKVA